MPEARHGRVNKTATRYKRLMPQHGCVNSRMAFKWLGAYDCSTSFALRALWCLSARQTPLVCEPILRTQTSVPFTKAKRNCLLTTQSNTKASPFPSLRAHSKHEGTNLKLCAGRDIKQNQTGELLWRDTGGIHWRTLASRSGLVVAGYSARYSAGSTGGLLWWDTRRWRSGGIHWRATLGYSAGYSAGSTGGLLCWDTRRDPLASYSGILSRIGCGIHWRAALAGSTGEPLWRDTWRDPLTSRSGGILGGIHWRAALAGYWAGSTGEPLWRDTGRDPLASRSCGTLGGIHWRDSNIKSNNPFLSGGQKHNK